MAAGRGGPRPAGRLARPAPPLDACWVPTGSVPTAWCRRPRPARLLVEERRLFYVACTRARERLVVTAVASRDDDGDQPSRFLDELGVTVEAVEGRPPRTLSLAGLVAELRRTVVDPEASWRSVPRPPVGWRGWPPRPAGERALVPMADPSTWWGTRVGQPARSGRCATRTSRCRCRRASWTPSTSARPGGSWRGRPAASLGSTSRPTSARWCTRSRSGSRPASCSPVPTGPTS